MQLEHQALERARLQQEEYRRKLQEIQKRKQEEELERLGKVVIHRVSAPKNVIRSKPGMGSHCKS